jgi:glutamine amidotransferase
MIAIVDYGVNNLASVVNAFRAVGAQPIVAADPAILRQAAGLVLPGVGTASAGMQRLRERGLEAPIRDAAASGRPILGLCLGMQLLFDRSEEQDDPVQGDIPCLGLLPGRVTLLRGTIKVPHIGWNQVAIQGHADIWQGLPLGQDHPADPYFYFVHSYICEPDDARLVAGVTEYGSPFSSVVVKGSIWATQFHPERSGSTGLQLIKNYAERCTRL